MLKNLQISGQTATTSGREMVREDKGVAASALKYSKFAYSPSETATSPPEISNAAAFTCFLFYLSYVTSFKTLLFKTLLENCTRSCWWWRASVSPMITVALVSPQPLTPVNQELTPSEEFGEPEAAPRPCSFSCSAVSVFAEVPVLGPWVLAARTALSPPATTLTPTRLHTPSRWEPRGREAMKEDF